jgi:NAD(P)H-dependent flavin oxidoreductase YrpB (nitropropane dioxygenase family)
MIKIENELTRLLGIKYPIIQGAMGLPNTGTSVIAVPVSEAGGLGMLTTVAYKNPEAFHEDLRRAKDLTDKPIAVNFTLFKERGFWYEFHEAYAKIALDEGVRIAFTSAYDGSPIGKIFQKSGGVWIHKSATIRHAVSIASKGPDAVVIVGLEGSGFKSPEQNSTLINMTAGRRLIKIPLVAAGGIADGYGLVGALAMGASGIYIGTGFMATKEFPISDTYKKRIINQKITDGKYAQKIYRLKHGAMHSLAAGVIDSIPTVKEYIERIMVEAEEVITKFRSWNIV